MYSYTNYGHPLKLFFYKNPKLSGWGRQFGQINFGAFWAQYVKIPVQYTLSDPLWYGTLAQLAHTVRRAACTAGAHLAAVKSKCTIP